MIIIAERINSSRKSIAQAIEARDVEFIRSEATRQEDAGAHYIDVNAGSMVGKEIECLHWLVDTVQDVTDLPLCI
ncbi:MAG: 5-methyltetrahydrofolate corrinoid/iron sulfur protein methyltransferase, partial [Thermodesulfobacteriota bacterium]|nr:5-methyltetrahydrofolate corrinoid/iron sulfur protein methyltransferase [Thermodesulfobacteriota bacterium]